MIDTETFRPNWTSSPGDTITDILRERELSESDFALLIGLSLEDVRSLLQGRLTITIGLARRLEQLLGGSVAFWMARDFQYRQDIARLRAADENWLTELPIGDMVRFGWLKPIPHPSNELAACLRFFGVPSVGVWHEKYASLQQLAIFRTSPSLDSRSAAVAAWLRQGEIEVANIYCQPWNAEKLRNTLPSIRSITRQKDPNTFIPQLQKLCAESGVAVAIVRVPSGCRASGAARFLSKEKALIQLSFRYLTDDHFWFTFFHEVGHLLLHGGKDIFLEGLESSSTNKEEQEREFVPQPRPISVSQLSLLDFPVTEEEEANEFAARTLIPEEFRPTLMKLPLNSNNIIRFAVRVGISPGIVVGQLQHLGRIKHSQFNSLKRRYTWES
jgi:plasmid maintenance system antidote protein VapI